MNTRKTVKKKLVLKKSVRNFFTRVLITTIIFLIGMILVKSDQGAKNLILENVYSNNLEFNHLVFWTSIQLISCFDWRSYRCICRQRRLGLCKIYGACRQGCCANVYGSGNRFLYRSYCNGNTSKDFL